MAQAVCRYTAAVMRVFVHMLVLLAMLWQPAAMAHGGSLVDALADHGHAALHWQGEAHHHHEDGSYQLDGSDESVQHLLCDHICATVALPVSATPGFAPLGSAAPSGLHKAPQPDPDPEGLLRPPRLHA